MTDERKPVPEYDYLWDRSGAPDAETARLEGLLAEFREQLHPPAMPAVEARQRWWGVAAAPRFAVAAAVMLLIGGALVLGPLRMGRGYAVVRLDGSPRVGDQAITNGGGELGIGEVIETDAGSRAEIRVGLIGEVELEPNTRMRLLRARATEHRLALDRGTMHARIWAPPRLFFVETPGALAIDLGCVYTMQVDDSGAGLLRVDSGYVQLEFGGRKSIVPEGAAAATRPGFGPGTPYWLEAPPELRRALMEVDFGTPAQQQEALPRLLAAARDDDALTLLSLLDRLQAPGRALVYDRLAQLVPPPQGVTREGVAAGDRRMIDRWWELLDLARPSE